MKFEFKSKSDLVYCLYNSLLTTKSNFFFFTVFKDDYIQTHPQTYVFIYSLRVMNDKTNPMIFSTAEVPVLVWEAVDLSSLSLQLLVHFWFFSLN